MSDLRRYAALSIAAALTTLSLKFVAGYLTDSVAILSDAMESLVNLAGATALLAVLSIVRMPPDENHPFGHDKAEYFSSGLTGGMIFIAGITIAWTAINRLLTPTMPDTLGIGIFLIVLASIVNFILGQLLIRVGQEHDSTALAADGKHLIADVWTSIGVIVGVLLAHWLQLPIIDPLIALMVALHLAKEGWILLLDAINGLMDRALPDEELKIINDVLDSYRSDNITFHALMTRRSGPRRFVSVHVLVPGKWSVQRGHDFLEEVEAAIRSNFEQCHVFTHLEPIEDPLAYVDEKLQVRK